MCALLTHGLLKYTRNVKIVNVCSSVLIPNHDNQYEDRPYGHLRHMNNMYSNPVVASFQTTPYASVNIVVPSRYCDHRLESYPV